MCFLQSVMIGFRFNLIHKSRLIHCDITCPSDNNLLRDTHTGRKRRELNTLRNSGNRFWYFKRENENKHTIQKLNQPVKSNVFEEKKLHCWHQTGKGVLGIEMCSVGSKEIKSSATMCLLHFVNRILRRHFLTNVWKQVASGVSEMSDILYVAPEWSRKTSFQLHP